MPSDEQSPQQDPQPDENQESSQGQTLSDQDGDSANSQNQKAEQTSEQSSEQVDLVTLEEQLQAAKDQTLRVQAEMQNLRRRADRDIENAHKYALENFLGELLPVVDNLERGLGTIETLLDGAEQAQQAIGEGIELTLKSFVDVLTRNKVEQVNPINQSFDPEFHQAMTMVPHPEVPANTVIEVFQKGYLLNGRLVRPAMVVVSKGAEG